MDIERIIETGIREVEQPKLGETQQFLAVHNLELQNGRPRPLHVENWKNKNIWYVYFRPQKEDYFLLIEVCENKQGPYPSRTFISARVKIEFNIESQVIGPDEISNRIGLIPTYMRRKGERASEHHERLQPRHWWNHVFEDVEFKEFKDALDLVLNRLESCNVNWDLLKSEAQLSLITHYDGYASFMNYIELETQSIERLARMGISLSIDIEASGPEWPDSMSDIFGP